ncbi:MAG: bifunctional (p)ppGpp synthetase/guanosine-3',5'-bis(diphosphate) 3'-pyrophosphohydrolase, partial [Lachnospiraceae bacterium]|nr:bifunctional (p)ppGpp synthetase/guanosine-3',5'-bis(diphosphate) 3'-pyrophosphohydrolase [Lachnospiraceae bacterium]
MIYTELTMRAMKLCYQAHAGQMDKGGLPYVFHPFHVAEQMDDEISTTVALLHDIVEDTPMTLDELRAADYPPEVVEAIDALSRRESERYMDYVDRLKKNPLAKKVKLADLAHN